MKVIAINGSTKAEGNTYFALKTVTDELIKEGIDVEILHIGNQDIRGCIACGMCARNRDEKCVLPGETVNEAIQKMKAADGILFGTPVHYSAIGATMKAFMDRVFYVGGMNGGLFRHKVGATVVAVRRSGGVTTFDQMNHYPLYSEMLMPTSNYWNVIHGAKPGEAAQDTEGVQIMQVLGRNMAWLLKLVEHGKGQVPEPQKEAKVYMNFVR